MKTKCIIFCLLLSIVIVSCNTPQKRPIDKLNSHIAKVEKEYINYSIEEWEAANIEFEKIVANIEANYETMTQAERDAAMKAIGRYYGSCRKAGITKCSTGNPKGIRSVTFTY